MAQADRVFSVSYIGDLVAATAALPLLVSQERRVVVVAAPAAASLLRGDERVAAVRLVRSSRSVSWRAEVLAHLLRARQAGESVLNLEVYPPRWRFVVRWCQLFRLDARHLDLPALLEDNRRSALGEPTTRPHRSDYYALAVGSQPPAPPPQLAVDAALAGRACERLLGGRTNGQPLVLAHLGSSDPGRRPPLELMAALLRHLAADGACVPLLVGSASEAGLVRHVAERLGPTSPAVDACGRLDLRELAALTSRARLFVGGDSGPLKIAEAVGAHTLSFWHTGQPSAAFAGPRGAGHVTLPASVSSEAALAAARQLLSH